MGADRNPKYRWIKDRERERERESEKKKKFLWKKKTLRGGGEIDVLTWPSFRFIGNDKKNRKKTRNESFVSTLADDNFVIHFSISSFLFFFYVSFVFPFSTRVSPSKRRLLQNRFHRTIEPMERLQKAANRSHLIYRYLRNWRWPRAGGPSFHQLVRQRIHTLIGSSSWRVDPSGSLSICN